MPTQGMPTQGMATPRLDLTLPADELTVALCDIPSVSGAEESLADAIPTALANYPHLHVVRDGNAVVARTHLDRARRVVLAGHIDTVPVAGNLPVRRDGDTLHGRGTVDMKGGVAVMLRLLAHVLEPVVDVTAVFYDCEEVEEQRNGLGRLVRTRPDLLVGDFAVLLEPTDGAIEGGCNGTMRVDVTATGLAAHTARSWMGRNAIHEAGAILDRLRAYQARTVDVDGLAYREGLNAVGIRGGIAGNVVPDTCTVSVNYRFAPDRSVAEADTHLREVFDGFDVQRTDASPGARPGLHRPEAQAFVKAVGGAVRAKLGWTDVSRFSALGVPAVNFGPGDPSLAHRDDEWVSAAQVVDCEARLQAWLSGP